MPGDARAAVALPVRWLDSPLQLGEETERGELVTLDEQDRSAWDAALIAEGHRLVRNRLATGQAPGRYQILAAINAVHTSARDACDTDWPQVINSAETAYLKRRRDQLGQCPHEVTRPEAAP